MILLCLFAAGCMLAAVLVTSRVIVQLDDYRSASQDNLHWTTSRLEVDQLKFLASLYALTGPETPLVEGVRRQFDILYSRVTALRDGRIYREVLAQDIAHADLDRVSEILATMVPIIDSDAGNIFKDRARLLQLGNRMAEPIRNIAARGLTADARRSDSERAALTAKIVSLAALILMMLAALSSLLLLVWRLYRNYRAEAEQNKSKSNRLTTILNTSQDAVLVVGGDGRIGDTNARATELLALHETLPAGLELGDLLFNRAEDGTLSPLSGTLLRDTCATGPTRREDVIVRNLVGREFAAELSADLARQEEGDICILFIRDISERLAAEAEIERSRAKALAGERAKARFLAMISHEMRTPLNGILGALELLGDTGLTPAQEKFTRIMRSSGQLLLTQITDALDLTQAAARQIVLRPAAFDLDQLLAELAETQQGPAQARGNSLRLLAPEEGFGRVTGDRARIYQVLLNLVSNAIKFTRDGEITLDVSRLSSEDNAPDMIEFQVIDTGIGISADNLPKVFDDFMRVQDTSGDRPEGTGLGLGIARQLVKLMKGTIGVESELGEGSLFWVRLPLPAAKVTAGQRPKVNAAPVVAPPIPARALDILVVEDNATNRVVLEGMLAGDGHKVYLACDGIEGVEAAQKQRYDLILMDISMPRMDGREATLHIRASQGPNARTPIVALTAHVRAEDRGDLEKMGFDRVETKPLRRDALRALLAQTETTAVAKADKPCHVDPSYMEQLRAALPQDRIDRLLVEFETEGTAILDDLKRDTPLSGTDLADRIHKLAGTAAATGGLALQALLGRAESALRGGDTGAAQSAILAMPDLLQETLRQLNCHNRAG
ncbi:ATP-binding protein [Roseovarius sp.]|uniref:ATP-binding protein n=1 Tax=Roseovarius sp. TaxID=1486281 RepID=UPI0025E650FE|nr:ATP-binding protein [Roseovarius sp.]